MSDITQVLDFAKKNPNDPRAIELRKRMESGKLNSELQAAGLRTFPVEQPRVKQEIDVSGAIKSMDQKPIEEVQSKRPTTPREIGEAKRDLADKDAQRDIAKAGKELVGDFTERGQNVIDIFKSEQDPASKALQLVGQVAGGAVDITERTIQAAVTAVLPEEFEAGAVEKLKGLLETEGGKKAAEAISGGIDKWNEFKLNNPTFAANIEATLPIAELLTLGVGGPIAIKAVKEGVETVVETTAKVAEKGVEVVGDVVETAGKKVDETLATRTAAKEAKTTESQVKAALEMTSGVLTKKEREAAIKAGNVEKVGGVIKPKATPRDIERSEVVASFVDKNFITSRDNISTEIARIANEDIRPALKAKPSPFNSAQFKKQLNDIEIPTAFKADKTLENTYNLVRQRMIDVLDDHPNTMEGLYDARIAFDKILLNEFGDAAFTSQSTIKRAARDVRSKVNDFINTNVGDDILKDNLRKQHLMFEAIENIAEQNQKLFGTTKYQRWAKDNPKKDKALRFGSASLIGAGAASLVF